MKLPTFLLITALTSCAFGAMMFFIPDFGTEFSDSGACANTVSVRSMGLLVIASGILNFFLRNQLSPEIINRLLLTNILTHFFALSADILGN